MSGVYWIVIDIVAPALLAVAIAFAVFANRKRSQADEERADEGARRLYEEEERIRRETDGP